MNIEVTIKHFDGELSNFDYLIPSIKTSMEELIYKLAELKDAPINLESINTIHFVDDYATELFSFQRSIGHREFRTNNKVASGHAQVVFVNENEGTQDMHGFHIFFDKLIPGVILASQMMENALGEGFSEQQKQLVQCKNDYIRMVRHELAHVEDESNQNEWKWLDSAFANQSVWALTRYHAYRMWEEYYACKRSVFSITPEGITNELRDLLNNLDKAEEEICELRWRYNTRELNLNDFVQQLHSYIRSALIYCCYFMGHSDVLYDVLSKKLRENDISSRFYHYIFCMWPILRQMNTSYPEWCGPEVFQDLAEVVLECIESFEIYLRDQEGSIYYDIPVKHLYKKSKEGSITM